MGINNGFSFGLLSMIPLLVVLGFITIFIMIIVTIVKGIGQRQYNNQQPVLSVSAKIVSRRTDVSSHHHHHPGHDPANHMGHHQHHSSTSYFLTFEVESGSRMEFHVSSQEYGLLVEGDMGKLTFQGTRFLGFERF